MNDIEKMYFNFAARGVEDDIPTKDKIRYTEQYLHSMRTGGSQYSANKEKYLEGRLSELRAEEAKERASYKGTEKFTALSNVESNLNKSLANDNKAKEALNASVSPTDAMGNKSFYSTSKPANTPSSMNAADYTIKSFIDFQNRMNKKRLDDFNNLMIKEEALKLLEERLGVEYRDTKSDSSAGNKTGLTNTGLNDNIKTVKYGSGLNKYVDDNDFKAYTEGKLTEKDLMTIADAKALYNAGDYYFKNKAHKKAAQVRTKYDPEYENKDTYDEFHGGKYTGKRGFVPAIPVYEKPKLEDIFREAYKDDNAETLVVIAAGVNTHDALDKDEGIFYELKNELQARYGDKARIMVTYPVGESYNYLKTGAQIIETGGHMLDNGGGKGIADLVSRNRGNAEKVVLIGHSAGGQAVGDALEELNKRGIPVHHALQFGAPKDMVKKEYADKVTRIEDKDDTVSNLATINKLTGLTSFLSPRLGLSLAAGQALALDEYAYPDTIGVELEEPGKFGGHSAYFKRKRENGTITLDNISLWIDKVWDKIK